MGVEMLEKNGFFTFGNSVDLTERPDVENETYKNFISPATIFIGSAIVARGRKKRADKNRQEVQDKYANLNVSCGGIDSSISAVSADLDSLNANKPKKKLINKKDFLAWESKVSETKEVLNELASTKRSLVCGGAAQPKIVETVEIVQQMPSTSGGSASLIQPSTKTGTLSALDAMVSPIQPASGLIEGTQTQETDIKAGKKKMLWLYLLLGAAALGGVVYYIRKRQ